MKVFKFAAGFAVGYVLGSRAGREKFEQIVAGARKVQDHPTVVEVQQVATERLGLSTDSAASHADTSESTGSAAADNSRQPSTEPSDAAPAMTGSTTRRRPSPARTTPTTTIEPPA